ncbi:MAG TPA: hypothetical protein VM118_03540 [Acidobacteriota bacterium]|nr:hypothetical protein [Acidobacteriota bacterium]
MPDYIPFVNSEKDATLLNTWYSDAPCARVTMALRRKAVELLPSNTPLWADPAIDAFHNWPRQLPEREEDRTELQSFYVQLSGHKSLLPGATTSSRDESRISELVSACMGECIERFNPTWISVPQLPIVSGSERNKLNRYLAKAAASWKAQYKFRGRLILPVVFTKQNQTNGKTARKAKLQQIHRCYDLAHAQGVWVVESSLDDHKASTTYERRFRGMIDFHKELRQEIPGISIIVAGPHWGLNLLLWARGLATHPAIGLGRGYQYFIPGAPMKKGRARVAFPSLRRYAYYGATLKTWLETSSTRLPRSNPAREEFKRLARNIDSYASGDRDRSQVAEFYRSWYQRVEEVPVEGRALALFQDLSAAYVLGKMLGALPAAETTARRPEQVARQLMLHCL